MSRPAPPNGDRSFESALGRLLGAGILASSLCLAAGLVLTLAGPPGGVPYVLLTLGLVLLMATPAARVVVSAITYARRRDWTFAVLTIIVLLELVASVVAAFHAG